MTQSVAPARWPWIMLFLRLLLFAGVQGLFALLYGLAGSSQAWQAAASWWPFAATLTNLVCLLLLIRIFHSEGKRYWDIFRIQRGSARDDLLAMLGILIVATPVAFLPNLMLGKWLFGDPQVTLDLLIRPLPFWAACAGIILFPVTEGWVEIATYFAYVMPRLESQGLRPWIAVTLPALLLGLQHTTLPLLFDARFIAWRALMFLPFAFLVGIILRWRPRLLPYLAIVHALMDMSVAVMFLGAAIP